MPSIEPRAPVGGAEAGRSAALGESGMVGRVYTGLHGGTLVRDVRKSKADEPFRDVGRLPYRARPRGRAEAEATVDQRGLVERASEGDHDAFAGLVDLTIARLDTAAQLVLRDRELARDAVQETLIRAWRDLPGLRDPDRFDAWLHRLTINACLDIVRRRQRRVIEVELTSIDPPTPSDRDLSGELGDREVIDDALGRLDPSHRAVVVLHFYLGMPLADVAATLRIPTGTAKSRLHYALAHMRASVTDDGSPSAARAVGGQIA
jgi:RNA polymerase sigma-70 factor (ECF subfamily)